MTHLNGEVEWISLHPSSLRLLPCWWPLPFWTCHVSVFFLWHFVAHLSGQVGRVSLHLLPLLLLQLPCWWLLPFWTWVNAVPSSCMEGGSSPGSQEGLGQLRGAAQLITSQRFSFATQTRNLIFINGVIHSLMV